MTKVDTRAQVLWLDDEGIIHVDVKPGTSLLLADAEEAIRALAQLCGGTRRPVLVDMSKTHGIDRAARNYFAGAETAKHESAAALIVKSPLTRALGNFFLGLNKPLMPTRLFSDENEALAWLRVQ